MSNDEILQFCYAHTGGEESSKLLKPMVLAMADLAYRDTAIKVTEQSPELAKKLQTSITDSYTGGEFTIPTDMLYFDGQKPITNLRIDSAQAFQISDKRKFSFLSSVISNHYFAVDGRSIVVRKIDGSSTGSYLLEYYKIPINSDIDDDLRNIFLECLLTRLGIIATKEMNNGNTK